VKTTLVVGRAAVNQHAEADKDEEEEGEEGEEKVAEKSKDDKRG